ncbi:MAG: AAA family ATPase [Acidobacteria bacterium]|nr:AAA family ATPase [Acidobacteriota bacterium]
MPEGVKILITSSDPASSSGDGAVRFDDPEIYFPLPSNEEQRQVVDRIQSRQGVLVQGPPGTGKSLTIANLICHLLAQGKRVLVTSHTERALRVLHEKLPEDIKPLCISLLGSDRDSISDLEGAIEQISARQADWSVFDSERKVDSLRSSLVDLRSELAQARSRLRQIRESDASPVTIGKYRGTSQALARELAGQRELLGWIPDEVTKSEPPLGDGEFDELLTLQWELPDDAQAVAEASLPDLDLLVAPAAFERLVHMEAETVAGLEQSRQRFGPLIEGLERLATESLDIAESSLQALVETASPMLASGGWCAGAITEILEDHPGPWLARKEASTPYLIRADDLLPEVGDVELAGLGERSLREAILATEALIAHATAGGKLKPGIFAAKVVKRHRWLLEDVRLEGATPSTSDKLRVLRDRLELAQCIESLSELWNHLIGGNGEPAQLRVARFGDASTDLQRALSLGENKREVVAALSELPSAIPEDWTDVETIAQLAEAVGSVRRYQQVESIRADIGSARDAVGDDPHPSLQLVRDAIDSREISAYRTAIAELSRSVRVGNEYRRLSVLKTRLSAEAPALVGVLPSNQSEDWRQRAARFEAAWAWREAQSWLANLIKPGETQRLNREINHLGDMERQLLGELAASLAWIRMFEVLNTEQSQALSAWAVAVRRVGKGKGKYAERDRRTARKYMGQARAAIPAWIMPTYRVAENVDAMPEMFDVVIVDEASQSSVESLFLFYLGRQVVVVGDDQQIAPEAVGIDQTVVHRLQDQYLDEVPFKELFSPESSLFDQANVHFTEGRIVLREHFRCMPEIIQFSNEIAYRHNSLIPLRQYGAERLDPIKTVYLEHGYREGRTAAINRPEAEEIVARIEKICADPRYDDKTLGVISLQGNYQSSLIERMLLDRIVRQHL